MKKLEDYISQINSADTPDQAFMVFSQIVKDFGYESVVYTLATDHPSIGLKKQHGLVASYPDDWMQHYIQNNYLNIDPVYERILGSPVPFFWSDVNDNEKLPDKSRTLMNEASDAGLKDGIGLALFGRYGEIAAMGLAKNNHQDKNSYEDLAALQLLSTYFHESYKQLMKKSDPVAVTEKERDVLLWASNGKTDIDIAEILNISMPTVRYRWNNIFKKLNAYGRIYAITKAIRLQLICPFEIMKNYQK